MGVNAGGLCVGMVGGGVGRVLVWWVVGWKVCWWR